MTVARDLTLVPARDGLKQLALLSTLEEGPQPRQARANNKVVSGRSADRQRARHMTATGQSLVAADTVTDADSQAAPSLTKAVLGVDSVVNENILAEEARS